MTLEDKHLPGGEFKEMQMKTGASMSYAKRLVLETAKKLWEDRINPRSCVLATHDTYLKMYQLSKPVLAGYEVLYVDEFQDTTPCVLDIVMNQFGKMKVVVVGDQYQAIYGWRGAVNAMKSINCETRNLTKSFRYGKAVADIATTVLEGKMKVEGHDPIQSVASFECVDTSKPYTRLFRSNSALLTAAVLEMKNGTKVKLEIDVKDFVKLLESAVALKNGDEKGVKHDKLLPFKNWYALKEEAKFDPELNRIAKVVEDGNAEIWIEALQNHKNSDDAHVTFTTAHKSKGREFDQVVVEDDFKSAYNEDGEFVGLSEEEQNLLYVACTRAVEKLEYNQTVAEYINHMKSMQREDELMAA
jgi:superfamily I DNA/RNA helicase